MKKRTKMESIKMLSEIGAINVRYSGHTRRFYYLLDGRQRNHHINYTW